MMEDRSFRFEQIIWDWNGTLLDDLRLCVTIMNGLLSDVGLPLLTVERYQQVFDFPVRSYYERLGFDLSAGGWERLSERFIREYDDAVRQCELHPGAPELLRELGARGVQCSVLTAARRASVEALLEQRRSRDLFGDIVGLDDHYAAGKAEAGVDWLVRTNADPSGAVLVGDTLHDHEVAEEMGIDCILFSGGHHPRARLEATGRPVVDSHDALRELLFGL